MALVMKRLRPATSSSKDLPDYAIWKIIEPYLDIVTRHMVARTTKANYVMLCYHAICYPTQFVESCLVLGHVDHLMRYNWLHSSSSAWMIFVSQAAELKWTPTVELWRWFIDHTPLYDYNIDRSVYEAHQKFTQTTFNLQSIDEAEEKLEDIRQRYKSVKLFHPKSSILPILMKDWSADMIMLPEIWTYIDENFICKCDRQILARTCRTAYVGAAQHDLCTARDYFQHCIYHGHQNSLRDCSVPVYEYFMLFEDRDFVGFKSKRFISYRLSLSALMEIFSIMNEESPHLFEEMFTLDSNASADLIGPHNPQNLALLRKFPHIIAWNSQLLPVFLYHASVDAVRFVFGKYLALSNMGRREVSLWVSAFMQYLLENADVIAHNSQIYFVTRAASAFYQLIPPLFRNKIDPFLTTELLEKLRESANIKIEWSGIAGEFIVTEPDQ